MKKLLALAYLLQIGLGQEIKHDAPPSDIIDNKFDNNFGNDKDVVPPTNIVNDKDNMNNKDDKDNKFGIPDTNVPPAAAAGSNNNIHKNDDNSEYESGSTLPNSCIGKEDGKNWLLLSGSDSSYMPVYLECSNEYVMLDLNQDSDLESYFSSFEKWHYALGGPANANPVTWEEWFLPNEADSNENAKYLISPDCSSCDADAERQVFDDKTSYWMSGNLAKLTWSYVGYNDCDMDKDTYTCYDCTSCRSSDDDDADDALVCEPTAMSETETDWTKTGICGVAVQESNRQIQYTRSQAQLHRTKPHYKPSIGTDGRFCVCYQPDSESATEYSLTEEQEESIENKLNAMDSSNSESLQISNSLNDNSETDNKDGMVSSKTRTDGHADGDDYENEDLRDTNVVYLAQKDFKSGTYRIKESGTYIITEDIQFAFNVDDDYWPRSDQSDEYPGAGTYRDPYFMGFFAGITVEADYVTIDLNGFELKQSLEFHYQQRWFAIVELGNQQFLPGQGPGFFGPNAINIADCTIKDGTLGLTSHFAIHGNFPERFTLENVHIKDFVTHGMQLNGWSDLTISNVEVGPSTTVDFLRGDYGHARLIAQRLRALEEDMITEGTVKSETIQFSGRSKQVTITDVADELEAQMELALDYAINRANNKNAYNNYINPSLVDFSKPNSESNNRQRWSEAKEAFIHESGYPSSSSLTGLFLNFDGASVFTYTKYTTHHSTNAKLSNVYIHDLQHEMYESMRIGGYPGTGPSRLYTSPWLSDFPAHAMFGSKSKLVDFRSEVNKNQPNVKDYKYVGTALTDAYIVLGTFCDDWGYLGQEMLYQTFESASIRYWATGEADAHTNWRFGCNQDVMFHSGKGLLGLRIDGTDNIELDNIVIENLHDHTDVGSLACGEYSGSSRDSDDGEGGHLKQQWPIQVGFSGNNLQGISIVSSTNVQLGNILVNNIKSDYGEGAGVSIWTANDISINEDALIVVKNVKTGIELEKGTYSYDDLPNRSPEACGFRVEADDTSDLYSTSIAFNIEDDNENAGKYNVIVCDVEGHESCLGDDSNDYTLFGTYVSDDASACDSISTRDDLLEYLGLSSDSDNNDESDNEEDEEEDANMKKENEKDNSISSDSSTVATPANVLLIMLDDLGRADVSAYGAEFDTPYIDDFISESITLSHHYIGYVCSASRSQFLTGRHSFHNGYGTLDVFDRAKIGGIPQGTPTIADYLKTYGGYKTYAVGKWQLGYSFEEQTPNYRGFDYFYGFYGGLEEYFDKTAKVRPKTGDPAKIQNDNTYYYDFWENGEVLYDAAGTYSTYQYLTKLTDIIDSHNTQSNDNANEEPFFIYAALQAPHMPFPSEDTEFADTCEEKYAQYYNDMDDRDGVCEAMLGLDYFMGSLMDYFKQDKLSDVYDNTLIIFTSDNGGALSHGSCNYPLRGGKNTYFDGNTRVHTFIGGGIIPDEQQGRVLSGLFSNVDWLPTLLSFGGLVPTDYTQISWDNEGTGNTEVPFTFDGYNMYEYIMDYDANIVRDHIVFDIRPSLTDDGTSDYNTKFDVKSLINIDLSINAAENVDILDSLNLEELAMVFYDSDGQLWKFFNAYESTNEIGNVEVNCNWCVYAGDDSDDTWEYTTTSSVVTKGLYLLDSDEGEENDLLDSLEQTTFDGLMRIVAKNTLQYFDNSVSESSIYLYGNFDCFYDKHNLQAWPGNFDGVWAPFLDSDHFANKLTNNCGFDESHIMYKLHTETVTMPDNDDFEALISDKSSVSTKRNQLVIAAASKVKETEAKITNQLLSLSYNSDHGIETTQSLKFTLISVLTVVAIVIAIGLCMACRYGNIVNSKSNGYTRLG